MSYPDFTDEEQYAINSVRSNVTASNPYMWSYVTTGVVMCGFAWYHESVLMAVVAFAVVLGFRLYEDWYQRNWMPMWRSIIDKYEDAIRDSWSQHRPSDADKQD